MGSLQSSLTTACLVVAGSAAAFYYFYSNSVSSSVPSVQTAKSTKSAGSKKNKKKDIPDDDDINGILAAATLKSSSMVKPHVVKFPDIVPGTFVSEKETTPKPEPTGKEKKSKKKKTKKSIATPVASQSDDASISADDPNASASNLMLDAPTSSKKKKEKKKAATPQPSGSQHASSSGRTNPTRQAVSNVVHDDDHWTRVESRKRASSQALSQGDQIVSDAGITTSVTETSSMATERTDEDDDDDGQENSPRENRKTFAEKMLSKPRKTGVEDMLETPSYPAISRVIRIRPGPDEKPVEGFSWGDYEDVNESDLKDSWQESAEGSADDGWGVVKSRSRTKYAHNAPSSSATAQRSTAPETLTKRQRQNIARREAQKVERDAADAERRRTLLKHKQELEKIRIDDQWKRKGKTNDSVASVNDKGSLVWS